MTFTIKAHFNSHPDLKEQFARLQRIPGIGPVCAEALLSETGGFERFERVSEVVAFVGLSPQERSFGSSVRGQAGICRKGNSRLRRLLYLPALAAQGGQSLGESFFPAFEREGQAREGDHLCVHEKVAANCLWRNQAKQSF